MNFNFKVRAKNPLFWIANIVAVLVYIGGYLGVKGTDVTSWDKLFSIVGDVVANPYLIVMIIVTFVTTAISYTDKGFRDTGIVQTYTKPRNDKDPEQALAYIDDSTSPMPPDEVGDKDTEDDFDDAEPEEKLDSEVPEDEVEDEDKSSSPKA